MKDTQDRAPRLEPTYTLQEVADHFRVNEKTARRWVRLGRIKARRIGLRKFFFTREDIAAVERASVYRTRG